MVHSHSSSQRISTLEWMQMERSYSDAQYKTVSNSPQPGHATSLFFSLASPSVFHCHLSQLFPNRIKLSRERLPDLSCPAPEFRCTYVRCHFKKQGSSYREAVLHLCLPRMSGCSPPPSFPLLAPCLTSLLQADNAAYWSIPVCITSAISPCPQQKYQL